MAYTTIKKPSSYFNTKLYTGNGSTQSITGIGFQPDFTWIKDRTTSNSHYSANSIMGANISLPTNGTNAEITNGAFGYMTSFDSDGFSLTNGASGSQTVNFSGDNYVAWNWKANGAGVANTDGSINSTVSANTTAGFSIVSYTGNGTGNSTIGHGLGATPKFIIVKKRSATQDWGTYSPSFVSASDPNVLYLSKNSAQADDTNVWGTSAAFNNNTFTVGDWVGSNSNGDTFIAYCFADVQGFSKFGSYFANAQTGINGTFIYLGFKPSLVIIKNTAVTGWYMYDNKRNPYNRVSKALFPDTSNAEYDYTDRLDFLSNGFAIRGATASTGDNSPAGQKFIYMAFAEEPLVGDNPATAR